MPPDRPVVVLPTYDERANLATVVSAVRSHGIDVLVVDDASPDGTGELADDLAAADGGIRVLHRAEKEGLGPAYAAGFGAALDAGYRVVCEMDADLSHDPASLPALIDAVDDADLAIGSRYIPSGGVSGWAWHRRLLSRGGNAYARLALGLPTRDVTSGFRAFRAATLRTLEPETCRAAGYAFQVEMAWRAHLAGFRVVEVPIIFSERRAGRSKMTAGIAAEAMLLVTTWAVRRITGSLPWQPSARPSHPEES